MGKSVLTDMSLGIRHTVQTDGVVLLRLLSSGTMYRTLQKEASAHDISEAELCELLGFLNAIGGLVRKRDTKTYGRAIYERVTFMLLRIKFTPLSWRRPVSNSWLAFGIIRACGLVIISTAAVGILASASGLLGIGRTAVVSLFGLGVFLISLYAHEWTHCLYIKNHRTACVLLQRGMRFGILHQPLDAATEIKSALAGPATGWVTGVIAGALALGFGQPVLAVLAGCIACFHIASLLPWYGDGASLKKRRQQ